MDLTIQVYLTTRKDVLPDLSSFETEAEFYAWRIGVEGVALRSDVFNEITDEIFEEAEKHEVVAGYALVEHPTDEMWEANDEIAKKLNEMFKRRHCPFSWGLSRNEKMSPGMFVVSLEIVVKR